MPKLTPPISEKIAEFYVTHFKNINNGGTYVLSAFPTLYKRALNEIKGKFAAEELCLIIDVFNATILTPQLAGQHLVPKVEDGIALDGLAEKWEVNAEPHLDKLRNLHHLQATALEIWACNFWHGKEKDLGEYVSQLT